MSCALLCSLYIIELLLFGLWLYARVCLPMGMSLVQVAHLEPVLNS